MKTNLHFFWYYPLGTLNIQPYCVDVESHHKYNDDPHWMNQTVLLHNMIPVKFSCSYFWFYYNFGTNQLHFLPRSSSTRFVQHPKLKNDEFGHQAIWKLEIEILLFTDTIDKNY